MTPITTAMPSMVAKPEISISQRTLATIACCAGSSGLSSSEFWSVMDEDDHIKDLHIEDLPIEDGHIESFTTAPEDAGRRVSSCIPPPGTGAGRWSTR